MKQPFFCGYNNLTECLFVTQLHSIVGISVWQIVWVKTNCYSMTNTFLPWLGIPNTPQHNYLACSVSDPPINVQAITHESGENQNPLRSLGYLLEIFVKRKLPLHLFKLWKYLTGQDKHNTGLCEWKHSDLHLLSGCLGDYLLCQEIWNLF